MHGREFGRRRWVVVAEAEGARAGEVVREVGDTGLAELGAPVLAVVRLAVGDVEQVDLEAVGAGEEESAHLAEELIAPLHLLARREGEALVALDAHPLTLEARQKDGGPVLGDEDRAELVLHEAAVGNAVRGLQRREALALDRNQAAVREAMYHRLRVP